MGIREKRVVLEGAGEMREVELNSLTNHIF